MNKLKQKLFKFFNNDEKSNLLLEIPNINEYELSVVYKNKIILRGGNTEDYTKKYDNKTGNYYIKINDNKYYYRVERYSPLNDNQEVFIDLITIKDEYKNNIHCGSIQLDKKRRIANILSLGNSSKCIKSMNPDIKFKYGDIIFQIMMYICKKENLIKIELTDNANITCGNYKLKLSYLKTMTHGLSHYAKYGFTPKELIDKDILDRNYQIYMNNPKINKLELIQMIKSNKNEKIVNHLINVLNKINDQNVIIKKFILMIMSDLENNEYCEFVNNIYKKLFIYAGYKPLLSHDYELEIK